MEKWKNESFLENFAEKAKTLPEWAHDIEINLRKYVGQSVMGIPDDSYIDIEYIIIPEKVYGADKKKKCKVIFTVKFNSDISLDEKDLTALTTVLGNKKYTVYTNNGKLCYDFPAIQSE